MSVTFYTGRKPALKPALLRAVTEALNADERSSVVVMVPEQLTLDTERGLLEGLNLIGSFRLMVLSPKRLCDRIFDEAGKAGVGIGADCTIGDDVSVSRLEFVRKAAKEYFETH